MARQTNTRLREKVIYSVFVRNHTKEGTFQALEGDLDRLAALGTDIIWLMPIHPIGEAGRKGTLGSPYAIRDFRGINPEYGTLGDFMHLVGEIHKRGMKCIIDVVYNHTSPDSILATGHPEFFLRDEAGNPTRKVADWSDVVDLDYSNRELESWNMLYSQMASDMNVTTNLWEGLLSFDCYGKAVPSVAKEWSHNEDSSVWTFNLRDDVDWVDVNGEVKAHLTSKDFLVGLEWVLNAAKNQANNTSMPNETLVGAADYYQKTSDMGDAAAELTYQDMLDAGVGVEAPDDYTLVFTCKDPCPYFDTVAAYTSFYPASEDLINELGVEGFRACDYTNMWYNGPYVVEEFISQNTKSYIPNPNYFGANDVSRFDRFTVTMISDGTVTFQLYQNRELDEMDVGESTLTTIQADPNSEYNAQLCEKRPKKFSYQMHFNYQKNNEDGTPDDNWNKAIANTAFRQCFYKGLNLTNWYARTNKINPLKCENDCYTMPGVCYNTQGQEYSTLVAKEMGFDGEAYDGKTMIRLRSNNGDIADLKKQAMDELSAIGVTFPVHAAYYIIAGSTSALDNTTVLKQCFTDSFGDDFIVLDIKTYVSSITQEVRNPQLQSFVINGWGADYGDPQNYLGQECYGNDNAYYSAHYSYINEITEPDETNADLLATYQEYTELVEAADAITTDLDARYAAYAKAEAYLLDHVLVMPCNYSIGWCLSKVDNDSKIYAMYGSQNEKMKNWDTHVDGYTSEEKGVAEQIAAYTEKNA